MFGARFVTFVKREKRNRRISDKDTIAEQVKKVLTDADQKLILMVRG